MVNRPPRFPGPGLGWDRLGSWRGRGGCATQIKSRPRSKRQHFLHCLPLLPLQGEVLPFPSSIKDVPKSSSFPSFVVGLTGGVSLCPGQECRRPGRLWNRLRVQSSHVYLHREASRQRSKQAWFCLVLYICLFCSS